MSAVRHHVVPCGAVPLQRTTTIAKNYGAAVGGARRHQHMAAVGSAVVAAEAPAAAARPGRRTGVAATACVVSDEVAETIQRGVGVMRAQTGLNVEAFAAAVSAVLESQPSPGRCDDGAAADAAEPGAISLDERVQRAQIASAEYVRRYGLPYNVVLCVAYMPAIAYVGALAQAERLGLLSVVRNWAGVGGSAVIVGLLAAGLTVARIADLALRADFARMMRVGWRGRRRFMRSGGLVRGDRFVRDFRAALRMAIVDEDITLKGLHDLRGGRAVFVVMSLTTTRPVYVDYRTHPDLPLWKAVRMAISLPTAVEPVEHGGDWYADGGALAGIPMAAFHHNDAEHPINQRTLGFMATCDGINDKPRGGLGANLSAVSDAVISTAQRAAIDEQDRQRMIIIDCGRMSSLDFGHSDRGGLMDIGATAVVDHFACGARPIADKYAVEHNGFSAEDEPADGVAVVSSVLQKGKTRINL